MRRRPSTYHLHPQRVYKSDAHGTREKTRKRNEPGSRRHIGSTNELSVYNIHSDSRTEQAIARLARCPFVNDDAAPKDASAGVRRRVER